MARVPADQRELLMQAYQPEARIQEVAQGSGRSVTGFYQWLHRMRRMLLDCIRRAKLARITRSARPDHSLHIGRNARRHLPGSTRPAAGLDSARPQRLRTARPRRAYADRYRAFGRPWNDGVVVGYGDSRAPTLSAAPLCQAPRSCARSMSIATATGAPTSSRPLADENGASTRISEPAIVTP